MLLSKYITPSVLFPEQITPEDSRWIEALIKQFKETGSLNSENGVFHQSYMPPAQFFEVFKILVEVPKLVTEDNVRALYIHPNGKSLVTALKRLQNVLPHLSRHAYIALCCHSDPDELAKAWEFLLDNFEANRSVNNGHWTLSIFSLLLPAGFLQKDNIELLYHQPSPLALVTVLTWLADPSRDQKTFALFVENIRTLMKNAIKFQELLPLFEILEYSQILNDLNYQAIFAHQSPRVLVKPLGILNAAGILTDATLRQILDAKHLEKLTYALESLENMLTEEIFIEMYNSPSPDHVATDLRLLSKAGRLTSTCLKAACRENVDLTAAIELLCEHNLFTVKYRAALCEHQSPRMLAEALVFLNENKLLNDKIDDLVCTHQKPLDFSKALLILHNTQLFNRKNCKAVERHQDPQGLAKAFVILSEAEIRTPETRNALIKRTVLLEAAAHTLVFLHRAQLLTSPNIEKLTTHSCLYYLSDILSSLCLSKTLTQPIFDSLCKYQEDDDEFLIGEWISLLAESNTLTPEKLTENTELTTSILAVLRTYSQINEILEITSSIDSQLDREILIVNIIEIGKTLAAKYQSNSKQVSIQAPHSQFFSPTKPQFYSVNWQSENSEAGHEQSGAEQPGTGLAFRQ